MTAQPCGSWPSPLTVADVTAGTLRVCAPRVDGVFTYWKETGADGRGVLLRAADGKREALPGMFADGAPVDVASRVHEYGGPDFAVDAGVVVFSARRDDRLYLTARAATGWSVPRPVTPDDGVRYVDLVLRGRTVWAVAERHEGATVSNFLVAVDIDRCSVSLVAEGADFYANPRPNPSGTALAWYEWQHPNMPWDATALRVAELRDSKLGVPELGAAVTISAGPQAALSPVWASDDELVFVADLDGWWNVYSCTDPLGEGRVRAVHPAQAEFAVPPWQFDSSLTPLDEDRVVVRFGRAGRWSLGALRLSDGELEPWSCGLEPVSEIAVGEGRVAFVGANAMSPSVLVEVSLPGAEVRVVRESAPRQLNADDVSVAEAVSWPSGDAVAHGFFYAPKATDAAVPDGELPPVLVLVHGGPTAATGAGYSPFVQFWTTRGIAVLDVNYRGSTGYGRPYREALAGQWGVVDIADIVSGVAALAARGLVDGDRAVIRGGSAGGYSVLRALTATDVFAGGTSRYGVADLSLLAGDTHKFESRYTDRLIGPYPEAKAVYRERSPLFHLDDLRAPVLLLQGEDDKVVPPNQAIEMAHAIQARGGDVELVMYPGEGHGFRTAANAGDALARELAFYGRVLGFTPAS